MVDLLRGSWHEGEMNGMSKQVVLTVKMSFLGLADGRKSNEFLLL